MKYYEIELKDYEDNGNEIVESGTKIVRMRLSSSNAVALENVCHKSVLEIASDVSMANILKILEYMCKDADHGFSNKDASSLYDLFICNGYTLEDIITKVVYKVLVHSGFLKNEELEEMIQAKKDVQETIKNILQEK